MTYRGTSYRWTPLRKLNLVNQIKDKYLSIEDAVSKHDLTREEIFDWMARMDGTRDHYSSLQALRTTRRHIA